MKAINTPLEGLFIIEPQIFQDSRGCFFESWLSEAYQKAGIQEKFVQDNISTSSKGVLRGLHFQKNQGQLVTVVWGKVFDVVVDIRPESSTYKKYFSMELSDQLFQQVYMPPGFAHGVCVVSDQAIIHYKCTQYYDPTQEGGILWSDPEIGIPWPIQNPLLSEKDKSFKKIGDFYG